MTWVAAVWHVNDGAVSALADVVVRWAIDDQGFYANPAQFDAFVSGRECGAGVTDLDALGVQVWAWRVEEHIPMLGTEPCEAAMVSLMRRNPAMSHAEFTGHWTQKHAPLARRRHAGLHEYHQYVVQETLTERTPEIDGIAVLGFATRTDFDDRFFDSDDGRAEIMADVARFMDRPGRETTLVGPPGRVQAAG